MAPIIKKRKKGRLYYYAVESARVDGRPRIVWQKYLGRVDAIINALQQATAPEPQTLTLFNFGVVALWEIAQRLNLLDIINRHIPKRDQGPSVGHYLVLAALNRAMAPRSKRQMGDWYAATILSRLWRFAPADFSSQRFWETMDRVTVPAITAIEEDVCRHVHEHLYLPFDCLLYDTTNFFTYISSANTRTTLAQRGRSKAKRHDLRQVGLALVVNRDWQIPFLHHVYPGNINDVTAFSSITAQIAQRFAKLGANVDDLTLIFDKGNNSEDNFLLLSADHLHFVGSLVPTHHPDLLEIPLEQYQSLSDTSMGGIRAYRTTKEVFGDEYTIVITFSTSFYSQQLHGWATQLTKAIRSLEGLAKKVHTHAPHTTRLTAASLTHQIEELLQVRPLKALVTYTITEQHGRLQLSYHADPSALHRYCQRIAGKTMLFTNRHDWSTEQIIAAYRGQSAIESRFRLMNDWDYMHFNPMFHWTDQKIRVHAWYCVLALVLQSVLSKILAAHGLRLPPERLIETLESLQEAALVYPAPHAPPKTCSLLSRLTATQKKIVEILALSRYQANRQKRGNTQGSR